MKKRPDIKLEDFEDMSVADLNRLTAEEHAELFRQKADINRHAETGTTDQDLREQIMDHSIHMIKKLQSQMYKDSEAITKEQAVAYDKLWPVMQDIIEKTSEVKKIEAKNASDVIKLISGGKITLRDAGIMMTLLQSKVEIEELPKLLAQLSDLEGK